MNKQKQLGAIFAMLLWGICPLTFGQSPMRSLEIQVFDRDSSELVKISCVVQKTIRRAVIAETDEEYSSALSGKIIEIRPESFDVELDIQLEKNLKARAPVTFSQRTIRIAIETKLVLNKPISVDCGDNVVCKLKVVDVKLSIPKK
jgi:hypothetical protein